MSIYLKHPHLMGFEYPVDVGCEKKTNGSVLYDDSPVLASLIMKRNIYYQSDY